MLNPSAARDMAIAWPISELAPAIYAVFVPIFSSSFYKMILNKRQILYKLFLIFVFDNYVVMIAIFRSNGIISTMLFQSNLSVRLFCGYNHNYSCLIPIVIPRSSAVYWTSYGQCNLSSLRHESAQQLCCVELYSICAFCSLPL